MHVTNLVFRVIAVVGMVLSVALAGAGLALSDRPDGTVPEAADVSVELAYLRYGSGPEHMVLIHGSPGSARDFSGMLEPLSERFTLHVFEMPGFGDSTAMVPDYSYAAAADYLADALDRLLTPLDTVTVLGFSWGGGVAIRFADRHPDRASRLVLLAGVGVPEGFHTGSYWGERLRYIAAAPVLLAYPGSLAGPALPLRQRHGFWRGFLDSDTRTMEDSLRRIRMPSFIIHSPSDTVVGWESALRHEELLSDAYLVAYQGGHGLIYSDGDEMARIVLEALVTETAHE